MEKCIGCLFVNVDPVKKFLDEPTNILPSFDVIACIAYFKKIFKCQVK